MNTHDQHRPDTEDNFDYSNRGLPRDYDIRIEVAEQKEIINQSREQQSTSGWQCSDYDF